MNGSVVWTILISKANRANAGSGIRIFEQHSGETIHIARLAHIG